MYIITPTTIESVAWEGELVAAPTTYAVRSSVHPPIVTIGHPEIWPVAQALQSQVGQAWTPPLGDASYWLVRLACTLREPQGLSNITEAQQTLRLRPHNSKAGADATYAFSLYPDRLSVESQREFNVSLGPELKFSGAEVKLGEVGAKIEYRKVFPVIQSYGAGESEPYWIFNRHPSHPLDGSQFVYAVVVARKGAGSIRAAVDLTVTVEGPFGLWRSGLSDEAKAHTQFAIPRA